MRIIGGEKRGTLLANIKGDWIRPTTDKVREAIFSSLLSYIIDFDVFVDCFAGSGAMGLEACSRGFKDVILFDNNKKSLNIINKNITKLGYKDKVKVYLTSAKKGLEILDKYKIKGNVFFMDPPYKKIDLVYELLDIIIEKDLLAKNSIILIEHDKNDIINKVDSNYKIVKEKNYGQTTITYIEKNE